jgi:hypothetical protein
MPSQPAEENAEDVLPINAESSIVVVDPASPAASVEATARLIVWGVRQLAEHGGQGIDRGSRTRCPAAGEARR